jgi:hypothetical protein
MAGTPMKRVVTSGDLTQRAMRPADLLDTYLSHAEADIAKFGLLVGGRERDCPACGGSGDVEFLRLGFPYRRCVKCRSLFVSPIPAEERLARYHAEGDAEKFRRERMLPETAAVRARHTLAPRARWVLAAAATRLGSRPTFAQVGADSPQLLEALGASVSVVGGLNDVSQALADGNLDGLIAFDVLERSVDLAAALSRCRRAVRRGGLLFVTTMSGDGFEVRMLGASSRSVIPPVHLHLLSREGWVAALAREGFTLVEYSTPGELDVLAVAEAKRRNADLSLPPIVDELVSNEDEQVVRAFQELLQQAGLSAHVQLMAEAGTPA